MTVDLMVERWRATLLIIEDDPDQVLLYAKALRRYRLRTVGSGGEALQYIHQEIPDLVILDHILAAGEKGTDLLPILRTDLAHVPVIVISGTLDLPAQLRALQGPYSAQYVIEKPVDIDELLTTVERALEDCGMAETVRALKSLERAEMIKTSEPERQFTERLARQLELLKRLRKSGEEPNISQLAREHKVSRRTIARDLRDLVNRGQLAPGAVAHWLAEEK
jgi:DNA-binding NtrC family response regulator